MSEEVVSGGCLKRLSEEDFGVVQVAALIYKDSAVHMNEKLAVLICEDYAMPVRKD